MNNKKYTHDLSVYRAFGLTLLQLMGVIGIAGLVLTIVLRLFL